MQRGHVTLGRGRLLHSTVENLGHACQQVLLPLLDLVRMYVKLLGEFCQRLFPPDAASATLALKAGLWFRRVRLGMIAPR